MARKIVVVGGGAAGIGAAGGVKAADPGNEVVVFTEFEDVAYSPCGIPYVHGKEIDDFQRLFLATKEAYVQAGIDIRYETWVGRVDVARKVVHVDGQDVPWDSLVLATGFNYADPGVPGGDLDGLYYVKNIREAMEWDKVLDTVKVAVVVEASPLGVEMTPGASSASRHTSTPRLKRSSARATCGRCRPPMARSRPTSPSCAPTRNPTTRWPRRRA